MQTVLLKLSGEIFASAHATELPNIIQQIKTLQQTHYLGIVVGGGNLFRGETAASQFGLRVQNAHTIGMLSTIINGIILKDLLAQQKIVAHVVSALPCSSVARTITQDLLDEAKAKNHIVVFTGGTGNPFFTTDTNAVVRALQIEATHILKATTVDGIFNVDPNQKKPKLLYKQISHKSFIEKNINIMDQTAVTLAMQHELPIRIFNVFKSNALQCALENPEFGSTIRVNIQNETVDL